MADTPTPLSPFPDDIRIVRIANLYGEVGCIKLMRGRDVIGDACRIGNHRGMVWMLGAGDLEVEIEFEVVVSPCRNSVRLTVTTEAMLAAVELNLRLLASAALAEREAA